MVVLGVVLVLAITSPFAVIVRLIGVGAVLIGARRLLRLRRAERASWPDGVVGGLLVVLGAGIAAWPGVTVGLLAIALGVAVIVAGATSALRAIRGVADARAAALVSGAALVAAGVAMLAWPRFSLYVVALAFAGWLLFEGVAELVRLVGPAVRRPAGPRGRWRRRFDLLGAVAGLVVAVLVLGGTVWIHRGDPRIVPDAFYVPPLSVPHEAGRLIRSEPMTSGVPAGDRAWRILYTTTTGDGSPAVASGTVLAPSAASAAGKGPLPVIAQAHGTTGVTPGCAPSLMAQPWEGGVDAVPDIVKQGWVAVTSDYPGLGTAGPTAYLVGPDAAHAVLDSVLAAHELADLDLSWSTAVWGHSQGGGAALWSGIAAPGYAPRIHVIGVAAFAPAADLYTLARGVKDTSAGRVISAYIAVSWNELYPDLDVRSQVTRGYWPIVSKIASRCFTGRDALAAIVAGSQLTRPVFTQAAFDGELGRMLKANTPDHPIAAPVFIAQGGSDQLILPAAQKQWVDSRCAAGQHLYYKEYAGLDHVPLVSRSSPLTADLIQWTKDRLAGMPAPQTC